MKKCYKCGFKKSNTWKINSTSFICSDCAKKVVKPSVARWRKENPEKRKAQIIVFVSLRNKTIKKYPCSICGNPKSEAHHEDYLKPLDIIWLCKKHHGEADKNRRIMINKLSTVNDKISL